MNYAELNRSIGVFKDVLAGRSDALQGSKLREAIDVLSCVEARGALVPFTCPHCDELYNDPILGGAHIGESIICPRCARHSTPIELLPLEEYVARYADTAHYVFECPECSHKVSTFTSGMVLARWSNAEPYLCGWDWCNFEAPLAKWKVTKVSDGCPALFQDPKATQLFKDKFSKWKFDVPAHHIDAIAGRLSPVYRERLADTIDGLVKAQYDRTNKECQERFDGRINKVEQKGFNAGHAAAKAVLDPIIKELKAQVEIASADTFSDDALKLVHDYSVDFMARGLFNLIRDRAAELWLKHNDEAALALRDTIEGIWTTRDNIKSSLNIGELRTVVEPTESDDDDSEESTQGLIHHALCVKL